MAKMGRPKDELKHRFARILEESNAYEKFKQILIKTKKEDVFLKAFDVCHDRAFGKSSQYIEMDLNDASDRPTAEQIESAIKFLTDTAERVGVETKE